MRVYLAGSIFYEGDLYRNTVWAEKIRDVFPGIDLYSPIENTDINGIEGKKKFAQDLIPYVSKISNPIDYEMMIKNISYKVNKMYLQRGEYETHYNVTIDFEPVIQKIRSKHV